MIRVLKSLAVYVLPVFLFDGCFNRDPHYYLDRHTKLSAPWVTAPLTLRYENESQPDAESFQLRDITEFQMSGPVFTGRSGEDWFIVRSSDGHKQLFPTAAARDSVLKAGFSLAVSDMHGIPWNAGIRANFLYPYNLIYYAFATFVILVCHFRASRKVAPGSRQQTTGVV